MGKFLVILLSVVILVGCGKNYDIIETNTTVTENKEDLYTYEEVVIIAAIIDAQYEKFLSTEHITIIVRDPKTNELIELHILENAPLYLKNPKDMKDLEVENRNEIQDNRPNIEDYDLRQIAKR